MGESVQGSGSDQSVLDARLGNGTRALVSADPGAEEFALSGAKVNSFPQNLRGYGNEVTNDAWMATLPPEERKGPLEVSRTSSSPLAHVRLSLALPRYRLAVFVNRRN
jgi:hypothetical protein